MRNVRVLATGLVALALTGLSSPSRACSLAGPSTHELDPTAQETDRVAPELSYLAVSSIGRQR